MKIFVPREPEFEKRCGLIPSDAKRLIALGAEVSVEQGLGDKSGYSDAEYTQAGAQVVALRTSGIAEADMVVRLRKPPADEIAKGKRGAMHVSFLDPFNEKGLMDAFAAAGTSAFSMEMMPRTTLAQKMDAISSQANLAGYVAVVRAAERMNKILPMMMTPAGTLSPARVFIIGVGVAGLQAIATAKRLGARVEAFDTRPVVEEQVKSLGAKFVKIDIGETGQTAQGYATALTPEQIAKQQAGMAKICSQSDIVITTAKLFGRKAPILVTKAMVDGMKPGSIVVDLAASDNGGNCELTVAGKESLTANGVLIIGDTCLEAGAAYNASQMYSANVANFIDHFWDKKEKTFAIKLEDEIIKGCLITHGGAIVHERFKKA
ncbi:MAG TPA: NAD(P) transhydrogenase subunit alpha [Opitutales bacterium]|nr:NAD(P) transhydrogenase subunit alpha [Opitutales bacterium]